VVLLGTACAEGSLPTEATRAPEVAVADAGVTYRAVSVVSSVSPLVVRTEISATNASAKSIEIRVASHCMVLLRVWNNAPYEGKPVWDQTDEARACTTLVRPVVLAPGESRVFAGEARPPLAKGRYFLSALLRKEGGGIEVATGNASIDVP
jgi:hypothetical protein